MAVEVAVEGGVEGGRATTLPLARGVAVSAAMVREVDWTVPATGGCVGEAGALAAGPTGAGGLMIARTSAVQNEPSMNVTA